MRKSTIKLTKHELDFASDTIYPETKQSVTLKMQQLFTECGQILDQNQLYQEYTLTSQFKITKGEQYKNYPYMVLDYPQIQGANFNFVLRTMFWWGHYISCNLIIRTDQLLPKQHSAAILQLKKTRILTGNNLWEQDLYSTEFSKLSSLSIQELEAIIDNQKYLKLSRKIPIRKYNQLAILLDEIYTEWLTVLSIKKGAD